MADLPPPIQPSPLQPPLIMLGANQAWNLVNFRAGLIEGLIERGFRVMAVAPPEAEIEARLAELGCSFTPVAIDAMGLSPLRDLRSLAALTCIMRKHRPAAWLSWTIKPNTYGAIAARLCRIPALPNVSGLGTAFIAGGALGWLVRHLYRFAFARAASVFFQNGDDRALFLHEGMARDSQARLLPGSGIDAAAWAPLSDQRPKPRQFLMVARVVADKGVREYVAAARLLRAQWPDATFSLLGPLDVDNRTAISRGEVESWVAEGVITYLPATSDVRPMIAAADFVVLPSYREGLSRILLEASAMGRPIVTTDVPGCCDVVRDGESGFLCRPRDAASLAEAMARAAAVSDADWQRMAAAARARVIAEFSQDRVTALYLKALDAAAVRGALE